MLSTEFKYTIIYSNRKTVSICINRDGTVSVRAPRFIQKKEIDHIIKQKMGWIQKKQQQMIERNAVGQNKVKRTYEENSTMPYLGKEYSLHFLQNLKFNTPVVEFYGDYFQVQSSKFDRDEIEIAFKIWYINKAKEILKDRILYYQNVIQEPFGQVRIKEQKSCYGSCSSKRNLNFNWKCVLAPIEILDYVVVHELCHLKELNHSKRFWTEVEKVMPDYKIHKKWLKEHPLEL